MGTGTWFREILAPLLKNDKGNNNKSNNNKSNNNKVPGTVWYSKQAERAFARGDMNSKQQAGKSLRVGFRNASTHSLLLTWVAENGTCHHFYTLKPSEIIDGPVTALDHIESTNLGHTFCIAFAGDEEDRVRREKVLEPRFVVGGYRPDAIFGGDDKDGSKKGYAHLVTISQEPVKNRACCLPPPCHYHLRRGITNDNNNNNNNNNKEIGNNFDDLCWVVRAKELFVDDKQIKTTETKVYKKAILGGWPVYLESNWNDGDESLERRLAEDLEFAAKCLPQHARDFLRTNTPVYVNRTFQYGPEVCPVVARGCCFHPEKNWLEENFMHPEKCECVEIYSTKEYLEDCQLWGRGGVLVHEFSHAYHHKCLDKGYDNEEIKKCFEEAMKERLYDWVRVHGRQGPMNKGKSANTIVDHYMVVFSLNFNLCLFPLFLLQFPFFFSESNSVLVYQPNGVFRRVIGRISGSARHELNA